LFPGDDINLGGSESNNLCAEICFEGAAFPNYALLPHFPMRGRRVSS